MAKRNVHVTPHGDKWAVMREGNKRASSLHDTQKQAEKKGREAQQQVALDFGQAQGEDVHVHVFSLRCSEHSVLVEVRLAHAQDVACVLQSGHV